MNSAHTTFALSKGTAIHRPCKPWKSNERKKNQGSFTALLMNPKEELIKRMEAGKVITAFDVAPVLERMEQLERAVESIAPLKHSNKTMKHWGEVGKGKISLIDADSDMRTVSIEILNDDSIRIREECDGYFCAIMTRREAVDALNEAIIYIKQK